MFELVFKQSKVCQMIEFDWLKAPSFSCEDLSSILYNDIKVQCKLWLLIFYNWLHELTSKYNVNHDLWSSIIDFTLTTIL